MCVACLSLSHTHKRLFDKRSTTIRHWYLLWKRGRCCKEEIIYERKLMNACFPFTASTYACLSVAFERYVSICWGQSDSSLVTKKVRYYIFVILLISAIVDVPRFFELTPDIDEDGVWQGFAYTNLRKNPLYLTVYTLWFRLIVTAALPFVLMVVFTLRILYHYRGNG